AARGDPRLHRAARRRADRPAADRADLADPQRPGRTGRLPAADPAHQGDRVLLLGGRRRVLRPAGARRVTVGAGGPAAPDPGGRSSRPKRNRTRPSAARRKRTCVRRGEVWTYHPPTEPSRQRTVVLLSSDGVNESERPWLLGTELLERDPQDILGVAIDARYW